MPQIPKRVAYDRVQITPPLRPELGANHIPKSSTREPRRRSMSPFVQRVHTDTVWAGLRKQGGRTINTREYAPSVEFLCAGSSSARTTVAAPILNGS